MSGVGLSLLAAAQEVPDRPALITSGEIFTYEGLARRVRTLISLLGELGLKEEDPIADSAVETALGAPCVAFLGSSRPSSLCLVYALLELGVPMIPLHPRLSEAERQEMIERYRPRLSLDDATLDDLMRRAALTSALQSTTFESPDAERCLALVRTSGSSGHSKGVLLSRRAFEASAEASAERLGWQEEDRWLLSLPLAHVGGLSILTRCLIARRTVVLPKWTLFRAEPVWRTVVNARVTLLSLVPTMLRRLLALGSSPPTLRAVLLGGAATSPALLREATERGWPVLTTYGLTESCSQIALQQRGTLNLGELGSGPPLRGTAIRIGQGGRIEVRGPTLMNGYLPAPSAPPWSDDGWLLTSDVGRLDAAGNLHVLGRIDDVIISGGENIAPLEVEQALEACPEVEEAVVFGIPDEEWGQTVAAVLVLCSGGPAQVNAVLDELRSRVASFARPRWIAILDALPRNPTGKLDRRRVAEIARPLLRPVSGSAGVDEDRDSES